SSPVLIEKVRSAVSDERGEYRIVELVPGTYTVTFTLTGFATLRREELQLPPNFNATVNAQLRIGALEESVTVSGASPLVDTQTGSTSAEYTSNGVVLNVIPREGGSRFSGTLFASGTNHNLQADNMSDALRAAGAITNSGTRSVYDANAVLAGPIVKDKLWFMTAHRRWGRQERIANLFHDVTLN